MNIPDLRRGWWLVALLGVSVQVAFTVHATQSVRVVIYNDDKQALPELVVSCGTERYELGSVEEEESREVTFTPEERTGVVAVTWVRDNNPHELNCAVERGERLTVRLRSEGESVLTRSRSLGRHVLDAVAGD